MTDEAKAAKAVMRVAFDPFTNKEIVAAEIVGGSTLAQQGAVFDLALHILVQFTNDPMMGHVGMDRAQRFMVANAIKESLANEGYILG